jgi:hypothetical protein
LIQSLDNVWVSVYDIGISRYIRAICSRGGTADTVRLDRAALLSIEGAIPFESTKISHRGGMADTQARGACATA